MPCFRGLQGFPLLRFVREANFGAISGLDMRCNLLFLQEILTPEDPKEPFILNKILSPSPEGAI